MKKFKLSAVAAVALSLGVACGGSAFAAKEGSGMPNFSEEPVNIGFGTVVSEDITENFIDITSDLSDDFEWDSNKYLRTNSMDLSAEMFLANYGEIAASLLEELKNVTPDWFPKTARELASFAFGSNSGEFLNCLDSEMVRLVEEEKTDKASIMLQICEMIQHVMDSREW